MNEELDILSLTVTAVAKLLKVAPKTIQEHICRSLPLANGRVDLIVYEAWLNQTIEESSNRRDE
ncbi:MAG: hypothetical protein HZA50_18180 [Planctomycetes bacterium]|nr:hypothetical protein [Planctomycetota bacterium]